MDPLSNEVLDMIANGGELADNYLQQFPIEIQVAIVEQMSPREILKLCQTSRYFAINFCDQDPQYLWRKLFRRDIATGYRPLIIDGVQAYRQEYLEIMKKVSEVTPDKAIIWAFHRGYDQIIPRITSE